MIWITGRTHSLCFTSVKVERNDSLHSERLWEVCVSVVFAFLYSECIFFKTFITMLSKTNKIVQTKFVHTFIYILVFSCYHGNIYFLHIVVLVSVFASFLDFLCRSPRVNVFSYFCILFFEHDVYFSNIKLISDAKKKIVTFFLMLCFALMCVLSSEATVVFCQFWQNVKKSTFLGWMMNNVV